MQKLFPLVVIISLAWISWKAISPSSCTVSQTDNASVKSGIQFIEQDWQKAIESARAQHKIIFLDAYASWCGPCKMLKRTSFRDQKVADYFNTHFINVAIDMEKGIGPELLNKYEVSAYPTLLLLDENGTVLRKSVGYLNASQLLSFATINYK